MAGQSLSQKPDQDRSLPVANRDKFAVSVDQARSNRLQGYLQGQDACRMVDCRQRDPTPHAPFDQRENIDQ